MAAALLGGCGDDEPRLRLAADDTLVVRLERVTGGHHWQLHAAREDSGVRLPADGTLAPGDSLAVVVPGEGGHVVLGLHRCGDAAGADCVAVPAMMEREGDSWVLRPRLAADVVGAYVRLGARSGRSGGDDEPAETDAAPVRVIAKSGDAAPFTSRPGENEIELEAVLAGPARGGTVEWQVVADTAGGSPGVELEPPAPGPRAVIRIPTRPRSAWRPPSHPRSHDERLRRVQAAALRLSVTAVARRGTREFRSAPLLVRQHDVAAIREEYVVLGLRHGPPPADWFREDVHAGGDYPYIALNARFAERFRTLRERWLSVHPPSRWQVNSLYRNPGHNAYHVGSGGGSGAVKSSWHQYGCAADLQTFPVRPQTAAGKQEAVRFWEALRDEAVLLGFQVEPRVSSSGSYSGTGHVHIELDCPP